MKSILDDNLARLPAELRRRLAGVRSSGRISFTTSTTGAICGTLEGRQLHSAYQPAADAADWAMASHGQALIAGLGLGYEAEAAVAAGRQVHVVDEAPELLLEVLGARDMSSFLSKCAFESCLQGRAKRLAAHGVAPRVNGAIAAVDAGCADLARFAAAVAGQKRARLLVVGPPGGGSLPAFHAACRALTALGHEVRCLDFSTLQQTLDLGGVLSRPDNRSAWENGCVSLASQLVPLVCREWRPDAMIALAQAPLLPHSLAAIEADGIPTALWFVEDWKTLGWWRQVAASYSLIAHIQKHSFPPEAMRAGVRNHAFVPVCADPVLAREVRTSASGMPRRRLSFCGAAYPNRVSFLRKVADLGLEIYGDRFDDACLDSLVQLGGRRLTYEELLAVYATSDINLNLHSSMFCEGIDSDGDFINPRTFEIAALGSFQLVDGRQTLGEYFFNGEMATFASLAELREKIGHYRAAAGERQAAADAARERVENEHTYVGRMRQLLAELSLCDQRFLANIGERQHKEAQLAAYAESDPGLAAMLSSGRSFDQCLQDARAARGTLTRRDLVMRAVGSILTTGGAAR